VLERRKAARSARSAELRKRAAEANAKRKRLYDAIENDVADLTDPMPKECVTKIKTTRDQVRAEAERVEGVLDRQGPSTPPQPLKALASQVRRWCAQRFVENAPEGYVKMFKAMKLLGVSRQTILQRVKRGRSRVPRTGKRH